MKIARARKGKVPKKSPIHIPKGAYDPKDPNSVLDYIRVFERANGLIPTVPPKYEHIG